MVWPYTRNRVSGSGRHNVLPSGEAQPTCWDSSCVACWAATKGLSRPADLGDERRRADI